MSCVVHDRRHAHLHRPKSRRGRRTRHRWTPGSTRPSGTSRRRASRSTRRRRRRGRRCACPHARVPVHAAERVVRVLGGAARDARDRVRRDGRGDPPALPPAQRGDQRRGALRHPRDGYVYNRARRPTRARRRSTCLEHMDEALLVDFLRHRKREHNGVLQGFVVPTGGRATCLRARVHASGRFVLESRTNRVPLADARRGVRERAVTFEGAEHEVRRRPVATGTAVHAAAVALARQVCDHVLRLLPRQYAVHEATFYLRGVAKRLPALPPVRARIVGLALRETGAPLPSRCPRRRAPSSPSSRSWARAASRLLPLPDVRRGARARTTARRCRSSRC